MGYFKMLSEEQLRNRWIQIINIDELVNTDQTINYDILIGTNKRFKQSVQAYKSWLLHAVQEVGSCWQSLCSLKIRWDESGNDTLRIACCYEHIEHAKVLASVFLNEFDNSWDD